MEDSVLKRRLPNRAIFTFVFIIALISFVAYFASNTGGSGRTDRCISGRTAFQRRAFLASREAEYPPDQGLANGIAYEDEKGIIHQVTYPDYDDSVRGYLLDLDSVPNVIKVLSGIAAVLRRKRPGTALHDRRLVMTRRGRIKKAGYFYARIIRFGGKDETLLWQKDRWVVLVKSPAVLEKKTEEIILTGLFDPKVRS